MGDDDFLVNQQILDFTFDLHDATRRSHLAEDIKRLYTVEFKELSDKYCDKVPWPSAAAVSAQCIGGDGDPDGYFLCVYRELMYRHMFAKLKTTLSDRLAAWTNYCDLFDHVLSGVDNATELSSQWVFDILHEFVYQFQSFCQYRTQNSGRSPEERELLEKSDACWSARAVLGYLTRLRAVGASTVAGAASPLHYQCGYFALVSQSRVECLLGDYGAAVDALDSVDVFDESSEFCKIFSCRLNVLYHLGYSLMMLRRYRDALRTFDSILAHLARLQKHGGFARFPAADQVQKAYDRMLALFAIALALAPGYAVDDGVASAIKDKYGDKAALMERGDGPTFDNLLTYASPKFVVPSIPDYGAPTNCSHDAYKQQIRLFNEEVAAQASLTQIRSYLKLYTSIGLDKLARFNEVSPHIFRAQLVGIKAKLRATTQRNRIGASAPEPGGDDAAIHFYVKGDMIHVDEPTKSTRHDDYFAAQMKKYEDYITTVKNLKAKPVPPPPPAGSPRPKAEDRD